MTDYDQNMGTFQNLCILALADGALHEEERILLEEVAEGMGLDMTEAHQMMQRASRMELVIPEDEDERRMELRMVVLMMVTDGEIDEREYNVCLRMAELMEIDKEYLDTLVDFFIEKEQEKIHHMGIFQNLYLIACADGRIDESEENLLLEVAYNLGLSQEEVESIIESNEELEFIIPEDPEEAYYSLKNLVYMMIVDGEVDENEYALCMQFAQQIGLGQHEIEEILKEYEQIRLERQKNQTEIEEQNIDTYLDVFNEFKQIPVPFLSLVDAIERAFHYQKFDQQIGQTDSHNMAFYKFIWLAIVRGTEINRETWMMLPIHLDLVKKHGNLKVIKDFMIESERKYGATEVTLPLMSLDQMKADLKALFQ